MHSERGAFPCPHVTHCNTPPNNLTTWMRTGIVRRMADTEIPTWRLRETLRRTAASLIEGRKNFERHTGRVSTKPLTRIDLDPREVLQLLDALDNAEAEIARLKDLIDGTEA